jgi:transposase InsO family protein
MRELMLIWFLMRAIVANRAALAVENLALRQQLAVLRRSVRRPRLRRRDRLFWTTLARCWSDWQDALLIVSPATVVRWHRQGFRLADSTVAKYMPRRTKPPSQTWRTFLKNHVGCLAPIDFCVVPTASFRVLYLFVVLLHEQRRVVHFAVTEHPSANWVCQQLREAFPFETAPRYLIRDRDSIYGREVEQALNGMGIEEVLLAPRSPWQSPFVERLIGSIRRECLDHVLVLNERHLHRIVSGYLTYYHNSRAHLSLDRNAPVPRAVEPVSNGGVVSEAMVGGLHHRYYRRVA